jgi:glutathione S-transferase
MAKVKLHRCSWTFLHTDADACWKLQRALDEQGIEYEVVQHGYGKGKKMRAGIEELSGQKYLPVLELPDGSVYRAESDEMAARVRTGGLAGGSVEAVPQPG